MDLCRSVQQLRFMKNSKNIWIWDHLISPASVRCWCSNEHKTLLFFLKIWILITHLYADCNPQSVESRAKQWFQRKFRSQSQRKQAFELQKEPVQSLHHHRQVWKVSDLPYQSSPSGLTFLPRLCLQKRHLCYVRHQNPQNQKLQTKFSVKTRTISLLEPRS